MERATAKTLRRIKFHDGLASATAQRRSLGGHALTVSTGHTSKCGFGALSFTPACNGGACIPQPGTKQQFDSQGDRLMFRVAYSRPCISFSSHGVRRWMAARFGSSGNTRQ
jgi:hypothetical protein